MKDRKPSLRDLLNGGDLIRPDELARGLKVATSTSTVYSWIERGTIPHLRLGKSVRFDPEELKVWLEEKRCAAS